MLLIIKIPDDFKDEVKTLLKSGASCSRIMNFLTNECRENDVDITFTYQDIYNQYFRYDNKNCFNNQDVTGLFTLLKSWQALEYSRQDKFYCDDIYQLERLFVVMDKDLRIWKKIGKKVVLFDTKHRNNMYKIPLGCFVSVDVEGNTQLLAKHLHGYLISLWNVSVKLQR